MQRLGARAIFSPPRTDVECPFDAINVLRAANPHSTAHDARLNDDDSHLETMRAGIRAVGVDATPLRARPLRSSDGTPPFPPRSGTSRLRRIAAKAMQARMHAGSTMRSTCELDVEDAETEGRQVRGAVVDALLSSLGLRALVLVHHRKADMVTPTVVGSPNGRILGTLLLSDGHYHAVIADPARVACAIEAAAAAPAFPDASPRLKVARDAERQLEKQAGRRETRAEAIETLAEVSAFSLPAQVLRWVRGGGEPSNTAKSRIADMEAKLAAMEADVPHLRPSNSAEARLGAAPPTPPPAPPAVEEAVGNQREVEVVTAERAPAESTAALPLADRATAPALSPAMLALSSLDDRLIERLSCGDIRLLRCSWLLSQPSTYRIQRRQDLQELDGRSDSPLLSPDEAVALVQRCDRSAGVLSHGWLCAGDCDPYGARVAVVQCALRDHPHIEGLFWDQASTRAHTVLTRYIDAVH